MKQKIKSPNKFQLLIKTNRKIGILVDTIEGLIIAFILITLIMFFASSIIHNILRVVEASNEYSGKYKNLYMSGDGMMNLYSVGNGEKTIIVLPALGTVSPVMEYKALADSLSLGYNVVIAEPLGYGYSLSTKDERTSKNIINELREALRNAEIYGPYTLLSFSNSSIYADYYSKEFPEEINGIITVDGFYPESLTNDNFKDNYLPNLISNIKFYSVITFSGLFRWQSYLDLDKFNIDKMQLNPAYEKEEIKLYRNRLANKYITKEVKKECIKLRDNMNDLKDFKFNENLPTLQIITSDYRDEYLNRNENISQYATNLITNKELQRLRTIEGNLKDYLFVDENIRDLKNLINVYF